MKNCLVTREALSECTPKPTNAMFMCHKVAYQMLTNHICLLAVNSGNVGTCWYLFYKTDTLRPKGGVVECVL